MPVYVFEAMDSQGREIRDEIEARSDQDAAEKIRRRNLFPTRVQPKGARGGGASVATPMAVGRKGGGLGIGRVSAKALTQFTRQFATLMDAGLPIVRSLDILSNQQKPGLLKKTIQQVREDVEGGSSLSESMARHPRVFDRLFTNMIKAGEAGGVLDTILTRLADFREKSLALRSQVIKALIYPIAVIVIAGGILAVIIVVVVPQFENMFREMETELPGMTLLLLALAGAFTNYWYLFPLIPVGVYAVFKLIGMSPQGRYALDKIKLHIPVFGIITRKSSISRFCRTLGTLIASGVPILEALQIIKGTTGNAVVASAVSDVHASIREGDTIAEPLKHSGVFDDLVVNMIDVGEETGELDKMLMKVADNYDNDVDTLVGGMMSLLEPFLIIGMGLTVGFIVIALFLPLIKLMETLGGQ
ncbi:MAG: type II secretion system F family protein [Planctomycetota bacterium]|jgi:type IV pilus assembly protein PilC